jgi:peptidoglycan L-alanyl-D-glutamate endopeptidase CwlK
MPTFGTRSKSRLATCDQRLQVLFDKVIELVDITIICGLRDKAEQDEAFSDGFSTVQWPNSRHNKAPSMAVDWAPWPIDWEDRDRFLYVAGIIYGVAREHGITNIRNGADWKRNGRVGGNGSLDDLGHTEIHRGG